MIRFHLDENVDHAIARGLRIRGIDVTTASDVELISAPDDMHVAFALKGQRIILTCRMNSRFTTKWAIQ